MKHNLPAALLALSLAAASQSLAAAVPSTGHRPQPANHQPTKKARL